MPVKTFRGVLSDGGQDTIVLHTNDGSVGYRIVKFQIMDIEPGTASVEHVVKIFKVEQSSVTGTVDFAENTLLGTAFLTLSSSAGSYGNSGDVNIIFDQEIFNQDIYVTHVDNGSNNKKCNYFIELEQITLDLSQNTVATLKDIRNLDSIPLGTP
jgi:hypothetical protein